MAEVPKVSWRKTGRQFWVVELTVRGRSALHRYFVSEAGAQKCADEWAAVLGGGAHEADRVGPTHVRLDVEPGSGAGPQPSGREGDATLSPKGLSPHMGSDAGAGNRTDLDPKERPKGGDEPPRATHPVQPLVRDPHGIIRFRENAIVRYLLEASKKGQRCDLNTLAIMPFTQEDREQFAQLIGYSLSGFGDLSYVSEATYARAAAQEPV